MALQDGTANRNLRRSKPWKIKRNYSKIALMTKPSLKPIAQTHFRKVITDRRVVEYYDVYEDGTEILTRATECDIEKHIPPFTNVQGGYYCLLTDSFRP